MFSEEIALLASDFGLFDGEVDVDALVEFPGEGEPVSASGGGSDDEIADLAGLKCRQSLGQTDILKFGMIDLPGDQRPKNIFVVVLLRKILVFNRTEVFVDKTVMEVVKGLPVVLQQLWPDRQLHTSVLEGNILDLGLDDLTRLVVLRPTFFHLSLVVGVIKLVRGLAGVDPSPDVVTNNDREIVLENLCNPCRDDLVLTENRRVLLRQQVKEILLGLILQVLDAGPGVPEGRLELINDEVEQDELIFVAWALVEVLSVLVELELLELLNVVLQIFVEGVVVFLFLPVVLEISGHSGLKGIKSNLNRHFPMNQMDSGQIEEIRYFFVATTFYRVFDPQKGHAILNDLLPGH